jgi:ribosomal protein S18 acetylase RimI-like enzyme
VKRKEGGTMITYESLKNVSTSVVIELVNEVFKDYVFPVNWNLESFEKDVKENSISIEDSFIALSDGIPVGFSIISIRKDVGRIDSFGVKEEFRGKGLASEIIFRTIETLKWKEIKKIILEVAQSDLRSIRFYNKHGFRATRELASFFKEKDNSSNAHFKYEQTTSDVIHEMAIEAKFRFKRKPNWQREPITIKLSENRYNYEIISDNNKKCGYVVWGFNKDNCYIVDASPVEEGYTFDAIIEDISSKLFEIKDRIVLVSVPEDDPLYKALIDNNYSIFIKQIEMERIIH